MLSLYIHIPFCRHKCNYCSFFVLPEEHIHTSTGENKLEILKERYLQSLLAENIHWAEQLPGQQIKSIYIGGGTPFELGTVNLFTLIDTVLATRDIEFLEELTIELNPDPFDEVLDFIREANRKYKHLYKLRFSIGIQTFDDEILQESKRNYVFNNLIWFFRDLQKIKQPYTHYNFDFIAFGKQQQNNTLPRSEQKINFFTKLVASHVADGYSLYTLELFPGSQRYHDHDKQGLQRLQGNDDAIATEFNLLKDIIEHEGYRRYEISNFALLGKQSIHNIVYRTMQPYLGLGINSSSFLPVNMVPESLRNTIDTKTQAIRWSNTKHRKQYLDHQRSDSASTEQLDKDSYAIEQAFLALRTTDGLRGVEKYSQYFEAGRLSLLREWEEQGFVRYDTEKDTLQLTDAGMQVYNGIITDLFRSFS